MTEAKVDILHAVTSSISLILMRGQLKYLQTLGFRVAALCGPGPHVEDTRAAELINVCTLPMEREISPIRDFVSLVRICRILRRVRPMVCNAGTPKAGMLVGLAGWVTRTPCRIYTMRGLRLETARGLKRALLSLTERISCACAHRVICVSPSLRERALKLGVVHPDKAVVLASGTSNGVDPSRFAPTAARLAAAANIRQQYGMGPDDRVIGYVGRLTRDKGISELAAAFRIVRAQLPRTVLLAIGSYESGDPVSDDTQRVINSGDGVIHIDFVSDIAPYYLLMDVLALPTYREGFPNTVLEAQAAARPVVTTDATGAVDSVAPGVTGLVVPVGDVSALANALLGLLSDRRRAEQMGIAGRERVCRDFRQEIVWRALADLYCELLRERGLPTPQTFFPETIVICGDEP